VSRCKPLRSISITRYSRLIIYYVVTLTVNPPAAAAVVKYLIFFIFCELNLKVTVVRTAHLELQVTNGGMVMVSFFSYFVTCNKTSTIADVVAHINHIRKVAGIDHIGIGAGYDGINSMPKGLEDVSKYPYLFAELLQDPSWSEEDLKKLAGLNFLRVFKQVEKVRDEYRRANILAEETTISNEELKGHTQCVYNERSPSPSVT